VKDDDRISDLTPEELAELMAGPLDPAIGALSALVGETDPSFVRDVVAQAMTLFSIASGVQLKGALYVKDARRYRPAIDAIVLGLLSHRLFEITGEDR
jgi:hypothetical protein